MKKILSLFIKSLRSINKAPFSAYLNFKDFQIISSSPERFIQVKDNKAHTRPIKGTRPRGNSAEEDERNKLELINSEKDKAELLDGCRFRDEMILARFVSHIQLR